jgi:tetratricopeptide (TPR) repeat protein
MAVLAVSAKAFAQPQQAISGERARRLLDDAVAAASAMQTFDFPQDLAVRFREAAEAAPRSAPALLDYAIALDRSGKLDEAERQYRAAAAASEFPRVRFSAAARAASLALDRGDMDAVRSALEMARAALPTEAGPVVLEARIALASHDLASAHVAARAALMRDPRDVGALCALARVHLAQNEVETARILTGRAAAFGKHDAEPFIIDSEIARTQGDPAAELAAARAAVAANDESPVAALVLGRALFERGFAMDAIEQLARAVELGPEIPSVRLALGCVLAAAGRRAEAEAQLTVAVRRAPGWPEIHLELARLKEAQGDAKAALAEANLFLRLGSGAPAGHPVHALVHRCEEALRTKAQASVVQ